MWNGAVVAWRQPQRAKWQPLLHSPGTASVATFSDFFPPRKVRCLGGMVKCWQLIRIFKEFSMEVKESVLTSANRVSVFTLCDRLGLGNSSLTPQSGALRVESYSGLSPTTSMDWSKQRDAYPQHILWASHPGQHTFGGDSVISFLWVLLQMTTNMAA